MMFLDETQEVTRKMKGVTTFDFADTTKDGRPTRLPVSVAPPEKKFTGDIDILPAELESQAMGVFFTHFTQQSTYYQNNQSLFNNLSKDSEDASSQALYNAMIALGLVTLYHYPPNPLQAPLAEHAEAKYLSAVRALNQAISDPVEVKADGTLLAVMILVMYETFAVPSSHSPELGKPNVTTLGAWSNHVDGAAALLEMRGANQFATRDGLRLFVQAGIPLCVNCMQKGLPLPDVMTELTLAARDAGHPSDADPMQNALWRAFEFTVKFTSFWGQVRNQQTADLCDLVSICTTLDEEGVKAAHAILGSAPRRVIQRSDLNMFPQLLSDDSIMPLGYCHEYALFNMAELSNGMRAMRLQINQLLRSLLLIGMTRRPPLFSTAEHTALLQHATDTMRAMSDGIVASVPQYLGYLSGSRQSSPVDGSSTIGKPNFLWSHFPRPSSALMGSLPLVRSASGCHLPWALSASANCDTATEDHRQWVVQRLAQIAAECNVQQASFLLERVKTKSWPEGWWRAVCPAHGRGWQPERRESEDGPGYVGYG